MLSRFVRDVAIYGGAHLAGRAVAFLLLPLYVRVLSPEEFGAADLTLALSAFALVSVALEVAQGLARSYSEAESSRRRAEQAGTALSFSLAAYIAFAILAVPVAWRFGDELLGRPDGRVVLLAGIAWVAASGLLAVAQIPLRFGLRPRAYAMSNLALALGSGAAGVVLVIVVKAGPAGLLAGQTLGAVLALGLTVALSRPRPVLRIVRPELVTMLRFSLPLVPASVAIVGTVWVDRIAIAGLLSLDDLGQYAVAIRLAAVVGLVVTAFQNAIIPLVYTYADDPATRPALARLARVYAGGSVAVVIMLAWLGPELVAIIGGPDFGGAAPLLPIVAAVPLLAGFANLAPGLAIARKTTTMAVIAIVGAIAAVTLELILIPIVGLAGAAYAVAIGTGGATLLTLLAGQPALSVPWPRVQLATAVCLGLGLALTTSIAGTDGPLDLGLRTLLAAAAAIVVVAAGIIRAEDVRDPMRALARRSLESKT